MCVPDPSISVAAVWRSAWNVRRGRPAFSQSRQSSTLVVSLSASAHHPDGCDPERRRTNPPAFYLDASGDQRGETVLRWGGHPVDRMLAPIFFADLNAREQMAPFDLRVVLVLSDRAI